MVVPREGWVKHDSKILKLIDSAENVIARMGMTLRQNCVVPNRSNHKHDKMCCIVVNEFQFKFESAI